MAQQYVSFLSPSKDFALDQISFFFAAEKELLESLPLSKQCPTEEEASLVN